MREFKVVVVGSGGVGKSALTVQFVQGHFVSSYDATIEDSYRKHIQIDGRETRVEILDTAGTEQFSGMRDLYVKSGQGFILVYSVDDPHSLRELLPIHKLIMHLKQGQQVPMVVVGNKSDLHGQRVIPTEHGRHVAREWGCSFYEASAKLNHNVSEIFTDVCRQIERSRGQSNSGNSAPKKKTLRLPGARPDSDERRYGKNRYASTSSRRSGGKCCTIL